LPRISLGRAHLAISTLIREIRRSGVTETTLTAVGGVRRAAPDVGSVSVLGVTEDDQAGAFLDACSRLPSIRRIVSRSGTALSVITDRGDITIHSTDRAHAGAALIMLTGTMGHVSALASLAEGCGLRLSAGTLADPSGSLIDTPTEEAIYARLGLAFVPPELREDASAIDAARNRTLPSLLNDLHMRGDLHMHSTWSDGRDSVHVMVERAQALGYEYVAITDHSKSTACSRTLSLEDVTRQRDEIASLRAIYPQITILHGVEVEILPDGSLDFDHETLSGFDIVLASLHDSSGDSRERLTERYLGAIAHPCVNVITHPANRKPALSAGHDVDFDQLFAAARHSGTALEVDGAPGHLDMDGALARRATAADVTIVVNSDSHRVGALSRQMRFGVATARRGWVEPRHVLNTRPLGMVREFIARKRSGVQ
jgi:DNA polymerase (family 10)